MSKYDIKAVFGIKVLMISTSLVIYDKPKDLYEFSKHDNSYDNAFGWIFDDRPKNVQLTRPPQSWCYVEVKE